MAELPHGVVLADEGRRQFVTQRGYWAPPFTSCMFAALAMLLEWSGYRVPVARRLANTPPENFVKRLHLASGRPLTTGSTIADTRTSLKALLPGTPIQFGTLSDQEFINELENGAAIRVSANLLDMPADLTNWSGRGNSNHAYAVIGTRVENGVRQIYWLDPMGRPGAGYDGRWIAWDHVRRALKRDGANDLYVTLTHKDAASNSNTAAAVIIDVEPAPNAEERTMQLVNWAVNRVGDVARGTRIYDLNRRLIKTTSADWDGKPILAESQKGNYWVFGHKLGGKRVIVAVEKANVTNVRAVDPTTLVG